MYNDPPSTARRPAPARSPAPAFLKTKTSRLPDMGTVSLGEQKSLSVRKAPRRPGQHPITAMNEDRDRSTPGPWAEIFLKDSGHTTSRRSPVENETATKPRTKGHVF